MNGFRGTNPQRHPWFVQDIPEPELPPECNVVWASEEPTEEVQDGDVEDDS
jgi:hypothetical protein